MRLTNIDQLWPIYIWSSTWSQRLELNLLSNKQANGFSHILKSIPFQNLFKINMHTQNSYNQISHYLIQWKKDAFFLTRIKPKEWKNYHNFSINLLLFFINTWHSNKKWQQNGSYIWIPLEHTVGYQRKSDKMTSGEKKMSLCFIDNTLLL